MNNPILLQYSLLSCVKQFLRCFSKVFPSNNCFYGSSKDPTEFNHTIFILSQCFKNYDFISVILACHFLCLWGKDQKYDILEISGILEGYFAILSYSTSYNNNGIYYHY